MVTKMKSLMTRNKSSISFRHALIVSIKLFIIAFLVACQPGNKADADPEGWTPAILESTDISTGYLPDYSYAGYKFGEAELPENYRGEEISVLDFGAIPDDGIDDSESIIAAIEAAKKVQGPVILTFPEGRFIVSKIIYIERGDIVISGAGSGENGTTIYFPVPMSQLEIPESLEELNEYLVRFNKTQKTNDLGEKIEPIPFSLYSWSGGYFWFRVPDVRVKKYLTELDKKPDVLVALRNGKRGEHILEGIPPLGVSVGDLVEIQWYNREGENASLLEHIYLDTSQLTIGSHHWTNPDRALVTQQVLITGIEGDKISIKTPLLLDIRPEWTPVMVPWEHFSEVGMEGFRMEFPWTPVKPHHIEEGFNAIYFTRVYNGWIRDVVFHDADNGILTEEVCNVTVQNITTTGSRLAHYSTVVSGSHNVLVKDMNVYNPVRHALSFNTYATRSVYLDCNVYQQPMLDQHSGLNHQNLFDNILLVDSTIYGDEIDFRPFTEGGAGYWKPACAPFSTFWNISMHVKNSGESDDTIRLKPVVESPFANLIGIHGNLPLKLEYGPHAYVEGLNKPCLAIESLYRYQLNQRLKDN